MALRRGSLIAQHVRVVESASWEILELGADLDRALAREPRPSERMRLVREATNRITRTANDAIDAYRKGKVAARREKLKHGADLPAIEEATARLAAARLEILRLLAIAAERYPERPAPSE